MPESPSGPRPLLRTGGIALLGVGVLAAVLGLFTSVTGDTGTGTAVPSAASRVLPASGLPEVAPSPPAVAAPAPSDAGTAVPAPPPPAPGAPAPAVPGPGATAGRPAPPAAAAPPPQALPRTGSGSAGASTARAPLRVYNNSLVQGLAAKAKSDFEAEGWTVTDVSGYAGGNIPHSTAYFRPGTAEESAAQELGREFGLRVEPRFAGIQESSDGVIVIVTEDYKPGGKS